MLEVNIDGVPLKLRAMKDEVGGLGLCRRGVCFFSRRFNQTVP